MGKELLVLEELQMKLVSTQRQCVKGIPHMGNLDLVFRTR